jgi:TolB-like protein/Tfp pilus assembly protein PilF
MSGANRSAGVNMTMNPARPENTSQSSLVSLEFSKIPLLSFGPFELEPRSGELRKGGMPLRIQPQPCKLLTFLAFQRGKLVTRDEIHRQLWSNHTFVDFDKGVNFCINQIRTTLGDDYKNPSYIETLPRRGYRFIAPIEYAKSSLAPLPPSIGATIPVPSLAVLPFENLSGDPQQVYFADGMTDVLITNLAKISTLRVISRTSVMRYSGAQKGVPEIARELKVNFVVAGTVLRSGKRIRITVQLVDGESDQTCWAESYERNICDTLKLQKDLAQAIADGIRVKLSPQERNRLENFYQPTLQAHEAYLKGRFYWNKRTASGLNRAIHLFKESISKDPNYPLPYAGLADCYVLLGYSGPMAPHEAYTLAKAAAGQALELDELLPDAHAAMAYCRMMFDWEWEAAESGFRRAIELNPGCSKAHHWYADYLTAMGRHDQSHKEIGLAREVDPLSLIINFNVGWTLYHSGQHEAAVQEFQQALDMEQSFAEAHWGLGLCYEAGLRFREAQAEHEKAASLSEGSPMMLSGLGHCYGVAGKRKKARDVVGNLMDLVPQRYVPSYELAVVFEALGEREKGLEFMERAFTERSASLVFIRSDPRVSALRSEPRIASLVSDMGFPH